MSERKKDPRRQEQGRLAKKQGQAFEKRLDEAFRYYRDHGFAVIEKTPEPMRPAKNLGNGKFIAFYEKKAQPDYKGVMKGGRALVFEAKFTSTDRMAQERVKPKQAEYLDSHSRVGARCFIVAGFASGEVYNIPWAVWREMDKRFGHKYVTEAALEDYRVFRGQDDVLMLLNWPD